MDPMQSSCAKPPLDRTFAESRGTQLRPTHHAQLRPRNLGDPSLALEHVHCATIGRAERRLAVLRSHVSRKSETERVTESVVEIRRSVRPHLEEFARLGRFDMAGSALRMAIRNAPRRGLVRHGMSDIFQRSCYST